MMYCTMASTALLQHMYFSVYSVLSQRHSTRLDAVNSQA